MTGDSTEPQARSIILEQHVPYAVVRLNRPQERNSLSLNTLAELEIVVTSLVKRDDLDAIIFTGTGDVFASGANIRELSALTPDAARDFARRGQGLFRQISEARQLTIAAVNGYCMGGGLDLALSCRLRCASPSAVFAHPGARLGIITGWGGTQRLPRLIGVARALEMFTTARRYDGAEALEMGLVQSIGDPVLDAAFKLIR